MPGCRLSWDPRSVVCRGIPDLSSVVGNPGAFCRSSWGLLPELWPIVNIRQAYPEPLRPRMQLAMISPLGIARNVGGLDK